MVPSSAPLEGTLTFLFTDIVGSTARWERSREAMSAALQRHDTLLRTAIESHGGVVFKTVGDAFCSAFLRAADAAAAAVDAQRAVSSEDWSRFGPDLEPLAIRAALHTGDAEARDCDYFGPAVNRVARLTAEADVGQILVSLVTHQLIRDRLPADTTIRDLGERRLRDLVHAEHVFVLETAGAAGRQVVTAEGGRTGSAVETLDRAFATGEPETACAASCHQHARARLAAGESLSLRPDQLRELAGLTAADLDEYLVSRVAEWSLPQHRVDERFVRLYLLLDQGDAAAGSRWASEQAQASDLLQLLDRRSEAAFVVLGPPGSGKSTLLRRLEHDVSRRTLAVDSSSDRIPFLASLSLYRARDPSIARPAPEEWLATLWRERFPRLPSLLDLLRSGRVVLLLDALNEMPTAGEADYHDAVGAWRTFLHQVVARAPGSRAVFSCRSLDFSAPLSSPQLPVPQVRIEPLSDDQVRLFLQLYDPLRGAEIWNRVHGSPQLELLRSPYFLKLLCAQVETEGQVPDGRAGLFTGFVRQSLLREIERGNPMFRPERLLTGRDHRRVVNGSWRSPTDLPDRGPLFRGLADLAHQMQRRRFDGEASQVRLDHDDAVALLPDEVGEETIAAAIALSVMDEDTISDEVVFVHQLVQEYMAARHIADEPDAAARLVAVPWRAPDVRPTLEEVKALIAPADPLPALPATGWEETAVMAAAMSHEPDAFVERLRGANLVVAARCAAQAETRITPATCDRVRTALLVRCRDVHADLRARIDAATALGDLGDPRFVVRDETGSAHILPRMVPIASGTYRIGRADIDSEDESPEHTLSMGAFHLAVHPVTNAEYALFLTGGGYDDERWWDSEPTRHWRRGEGTAEGVRAAVRYWLTVYRENPNELESRRASGRYDDDQFGLWRCRLDMDASALEAHLRASYPSGPLTEPQYWRDSALNRTNMPVVGVSWFEAGAYAAWLSAMSGRAYRLPTEAEWEAAARGTGGRMYAFGDTFDVARANTAECHLRRPTPVGVFPLGETPEGLSDITGNVWEWTASLYGRRPDHPDFAYPYRSDDGRENPCACADVCRVARGGSWFYDAEAARATTRYTYYPDGRNYNLGFRLAMDGDT